MEIEVLLVCLSALEDVTGSFRISGVEVYPGDLLHSIKKGAGVTPAVTRLE